MAMKAIMTDDEKRGRFFFLDFCFDFCIVCFVLFVLVWFFSGGGGGVNSYSQQ